MHLLMQTAALERGSGCRDIAVVAHCGYFKIGDIEACEQAGMEPFTSPPGASTAGCAASTTTA
jgi:hypothetical protein